MVGAHTTICNGLVFQLQISNKLIGGKRVIVSTISLDLDGVQMGFMFKLVFAFNGLGHS